MIEIHTLGWKGDRAIGSAEDPSASLYVRVFVDGVEIPQVTRARVYYRDDGFALATVAIVGAVEVVNHTAESWKALPA